MTKGSFGLAAAGIIVRPSFPGAAPNLSGAMTTNKQNSKAGIDFNKYSFLMVFCVFIFSPAHSMSLTR
jgi:hypothetical protein